MLPVITDPNLSPTSSAYLEKLSICIFISLPVIDIIEPSDNPPHTSFLIQKGTLRISYKVLSMRQCINVPPSYLVSQRTLIEQYLWETSLYSNLYLDNQRVYHLPLWNIFSHTDTLITLPSYTSILNYVSSFLGHPASPLLTLDHVTPLLLLILSESDLVIYTSRYLLSTLLYYISLWLRLVVSNPAIGFWRMDHVVTVYIVEPLGPYYPKLDLLLYSLK